MEKEIFYTLLSGLPVAALLLFFLSRLVSKRDDFENNLVKEIGGLRTGISELDKRLALAAKDIEHVATLAPVLTDLVDRVSKIEYDIDNNFKRLRKLEGAA